MCSKIRDCIRYLKRDNVHRIQRYSGDSSYKCTTPVHTSQNMHKKTKNLCMTYMIRTTAVHIFQDMHKELEKLGIYQAVRSRTQTGGFPPPCHSAPDAESGKNLASGLPPPCHSASVSFRT